MGYLGRCACLVLVLLPLCGAPARAEDRVVYHFDDTLLQATRGLRAIRNHLDLAPDTKIRVVGHADGIDFLLEGARDEKNDIDYAALVSDLKSRGVVFEVCEITMERRGMNRDQFQLEAEFTPSGVVRLTELQSREGYAYIKP